MNKYKIFAWCRLFYQTNNAVLIGLLTVNLLAIYKREHKWGEILVFSDILAITLDLLWTSIVLSFFVTCASYHFFRKNMKKREHAVHHELVILQTDMASVFDQITDFFCNSHLDLIDNHKNKFISAGLRSPIFMAHRNRWISYIEVNCQTLNASSVISICYHSQYHSKRLFDYPAFLQLLKTHQESASATNSYA